MKSIQPQSRWTDTEEDTALLAKRRQEKEEKRQRKAAERLHETAAAAAAEPGPAEDAPTEWAGRPTKRRKFIDEPDGHQIGGSSHDPAAGQVSNPVRFPTRRFGRAQTVDNYEKLNDIEEGTYGWVARAKHVRTGEIVALKKLKLDPKDRNGLPVTGLREIEILKSCRHRNVVELKEIVVGNEWSRPDNSIFLVLEFVEHDLKTVLEDMPEPFLPSEIKLLLLHLVSGLAYLHDNWILHRDLKTSNLLLSNRGLLKIADFGMARYVGNPGARLTRLVVTLWYRAPELLMGARDYDSAVDMWSAGCIFAELLTREPLLQGANEVDQVAKTFDLCGLPTPSNWPAFSRLPNARALKVPKSGSASASAGATIRAKFPFLTAAGCSLLTELLSLDPDKRPTAKQVLEHEYFQQDPKPKQESMFPTFPSRAGQEHRKRHEPHAPARGRGAELRHIDFSGIFQNRDEDKGAGFSLRMA